MPIIAITWLPADCVDRIKQLMEAEGLRLLDILPDKWDGIYNLIYEGDGYTFRLERKVKAIVKPIAPKAIVQAIGTYHRR